MTEEMFRIMVADFDMAFKKLIELYPEFAETIEAEKRMLISRVAMDRALTDLKEATDKIKQDLQGIFKS